MGKRILIPGLIALLLVAGVSAWLVLNPPWQGNRSGESASESGTPDATAHRPFEETQGRQDADATSVQPGSRAGSEADGGGSKDGRTDVRPDGTGVPNSDAGASSGNSRAATGSSKPGSTAPNQSAGKPAHSKERSKIIDATRPPNQTLGNARPVSRVIKTPPAKKLEDVSEKLKQDRRGLYAQYYAFQSEPLAELSKPEAKTLAQRDANLVRIDNQVHFPNNESFADLPFDLANFAATWDGYLVIPEQGEYWLFLGADNAARVDLDGETVLLNDVQSRYIEVSTVLELAPGLHPLHIEFAQGMLANEDSWRCAASFMWVPKGQQKPVPVPLEMLMVPDWMWSDDAPIITKLSEYEGEIGDEIVISGQGFCPVEQRKESDGGAILDELFGPRVLFNGQVAKVLKYTNLEVTVRVPIGASSGRLIVFRNLPIPGDPATGNYSGPPIGRATPSNSVYFKVTTQFGLMSQWYNLAGEPNPALDTLGSRAPDISRIEGNPLWYSRENAPVPFANQNLACVWEGFLGVPHAWAPLHATKRWLCIDSVDAIRVTLDGVSVMPEETTSTETRHARIEVTWGEERKLPLRIEWLALHNQHTIFPMQFEVRFIQSIEQSGAQTVDRIWSEYRVLRDCFLFPPVTPPKPPRIASVISLTIAGDETPTAPFPATPGLVSVREGQQFKCNVEIFGDEDVRAASVTLSVDGHVIECGSGTLIDDSANKRWFRQFVGVLPPGCGEGKLTAKLGLSTSEPFYVDVANKGLIAYLYDLPNPSGYSQFPNILPLTCHTIRKEREINFGTADSFNLPFVAETFAIEWYGAIIIEQDGWYTFTSRTDDGCRVWLNGIEIIDDDNLHAPQEKSSERIKLVAGTYPFRMQFFENNMHEECVLFLAAVDLQEKELLARQVVPKRMFTWEVHDMLPEKVATGRKADGSE